MVVANTLAYYDTAQQLLTKMFLGTNLRLLGTFSHLFIFFLT